MAIPPGLSAADWANALKQFTDVVGSQWVFTSDEDVALYRDAYSPSWGEPEERLVSAAVAPDTVEQVSQIVKIANRYRVPLFAISTGKNLGYGGSAGNVSGTRDSNGPSANYITYTYDLLNRRTQAQVYVSTRQGVAATLASATYVYDLANEVTSQTDRK